MKFLRLPFNLNAEKQIIKIYAGDKVHQSIEMRYCPEDPTIWFSMPVDDKADRYTVSEDPFTPIIDNEFHRESSLNNSYPRPKLSFSPEFGWNNDPNGLFFLSGKWHMFFQSNPVGVEWENMTWGHAVSEDLVHWKELEPALLPDDCGTMFSGSAFVDLDCASGLGSPENPAVLLYYTAAGGTNAISEGKQFTQCLAYSLDGGTTFQKYRENPVISTICPCTRDPKVVKTDNGYILALYLDAPERNKYALFDSKDLLHWHKSCEIDLPEDGECPDIYPVRDHTWVFSGASDRYLIGDLNNNIFESSMKTPLALHRNGGLGYAAQTWNNVSDNRIVKVYWNRWGDLDYRGQYHCCMSTPLDITLKQVCGEQKLCADICPEVLKQLTAVQSSDVIIGKQSIPYHPTCLISFNVQEDSEFRISYAGYDIAYLKDDLIVDGKTYEMKCSVGEVRFLFDGVNVQIHLEQGAFYLQLAKMPTQTDGYLYSEHKLTNYRLRVID